MDRLSLDRLMGAAWLAYVPGQGPIGAQSLIEADIPSGTRRLVLRTINSNTTSTHTAFDANFVALSIDAADWLLAQGIDLIGIDGPSIEPFESPGDPVHRRLLTAGVIIIENLAIADIPPGVCQFCCLPLPLADGDGAPSTGNPDP